MQIVSNLRIEYNSLLISIDIAIEELIKKYGVDFDGYHGLRIKPNSFYVEGRSIDLITETVFYAEGLTYQHHCVDIEEIISMLETFQK